MRQRYQERKGKHKKRPQSTRAASKRWDCCPARSRSFSKPQTRRMWMKWRSRGHGDTDMDDEELESAAKDLDQGPGSLSLNLDSDRD